MIAKMLIGFIILSSSSCSVFQDPQKLEKIGEDVANDAIQIYEDAVAPSTDQKQDVKDARH